MKTKIFILVLSVFILTGCATIRRNQDTSASGGALQTKVANLEQEMASRDQEITDLKYEVDRLNDRLSSQSSDSSGGSSYRRIEYTPADVTKDNFGSSDDDRIVRVPVSNEKVQKALKNAGYYNGNIDGKLGAKTKSAIKEFQKAQDLKPDGVVGKATWAALKSYVE